MRLQRATCRYINDGTRKRVHFRNTAMQKHLGTPFHQNNISEYEPSTCSHVQDPPATHSQFSHLISFLFGKNRKPLYNAELCCSEIFSGLPHATPVYFAVALVTGVAGNCENNQHKAVVPISWGTGAFKCH